MSKRAILISLGISIATLVVVAYMRGRKREDGEVAREDSGGGTVTRVRRGIANIALNGGLVTGGTVAK